MTPAKTLKRVTPRQIYTTDQRLLAEIRDDLWALPLAAEVRRGDVDTVKKLRVELDSIREDLDDLKAANMLLARLVGLHPEKLDNDELALLVEVGALDLTEADG